MCLFGNWFDLNGDGKTDMFEQYAAMEAMGMFDKNEDKDNDADDEYQDDDEE